MHIGNLRTCLYAFLFARKNNGTFILRIEDTDQGRYVEGAVDVIYYTQRETGLLWDEGPDIGGPVGPYVQSQRMGMFKQYAEQLVAVMDFIDHYPTEQSCFIGFFMMERAVQGHGIGSRIITELCVYLHSLGYEYIRLGYVDGNKQSESFWKKNQFTDTGLRNHTQDYTVVVMNRML